MIILFGFAIGAAILSLIWGITARPPAARANLMAGLDMAQPLSRNEITWPSWATTGLDVKLAKAGNPYGLTVGRFMLIKLGVPIGLAGLFLAVGQPILALLCAVFGFILPNIWVSSQVDARMNVIRSSVADTVDQLVICVEGGLGFDAALYRVASTNQGPLASELHHTVEDMRVGVPRDQALRALAERTQVPEMHQFVTAMVQAQRHGISVADTLRIHAAELRIKRKQRIEEHAAKMGVKMVFPTILCFLPMFFVTLLVPSIAALGKALG